MKTKNELVAQVGNLLYRRLAVGWTQKCRTAADCQSATQQTASLRYLGRHRDHRDSGGPAAPGAVPSQSQGPIGCVPEQPETARAGMDVVCGRQRRSPGREHLGGAGEPTRLVGAGQHQARSDSQQYYGGRDVQVRSGCGRLSLPGGPFYGYWREGPVAHAELHAQRLDEFLADPVNPWLALAVGGPPISRACRKSCHRLSARHRQEPSSLSTSTRRASMMGSGTPIRTRWLRPECQC